MTLAQTREARALALAALRRGLIEPEALWDVACRSIQGEAPSPRELLGGLLTPEQLDEIAEPLDPVETPDNDESSKRLSPGHRGLETLHYDYASSPSPELRAAESSPSGLSAPRYDFGEPLGAGGVGKVVRARDREIGRVVALKTLKLGTDAQPSVAARFIAEARVTAQLEHPNIVPVYDLGALPDGQPYYTMRVVKRQSLQDVMGNPELRKQWPLVRLAGAFVQVSRALAYAHSRGVLHRDIKPENILLGDFGEIYLADWGNAKTMDSEDVAQPIFEGAAKTTLKTAQSGLSGTPGYMAPEQIRGEKGKIDHRADVFALGVVLYEMLTSEHPFDAPTVLTVIVATQSREPRPPRSIVPSCPLVLEDLCLAMLSKDPAKRPESADRVAAEVEAFLEGAKEKLRRREEAQKLCELAKVPVERDTVLGEERQRLIEEARRLLQDVKGFEPIDMKRPGWDLEDRAEAVEREQARAMAEAIDLHTKALAYDPEFVEARSGLADMYWSRAVRAEDERRAAERVYYEALVSEFDVGKYAALLKADAALSLDSNPPGAVVLAYRYVEKDRILVASEERYLGRTPLREARMNPGSYLIVLKRAGFRDVRYPVFLKRGAHHHGEVNLYSDAEIGGDFVYIPGGPFVPGGDSAAYDALKRVEANVGDFAIARFPVTFRQYCTFLDDLQQIDPALAAKRAPRDSSGSEGYAVKLSDARRWEPMPFLEGEVRKRFPAEDGHMWNLPVMLIDWFDAVAYCKHLGAQSPGLRLPAEIEWEKASRGADGRFFPWGDHFDPTFCHMRFSRPWHPQPEPIGTFPTDVSPYGVRDLAGGMREWVGDIHGELTWQQASSESEPALDTTRDESSWRIFRSGNWATEQHRCRAASRTRFFALTRTSNLSFRVARTLVRASRRP